MLRPDPTRRFSYWLFATLLLLATDRLPAADPGKLDDARRGEGSIARGKDSEQLDQARVVLAANGRAEIEVRSFRGPYRFAGTWSPGPGSHVKLQIDETDGARGADGHGWIEIAGNGFARIEIDGRNAAGGKLAVSFRATGPAPLGWQGLDVRGDGSGDLERSGRRVRVQSVRVVMQPDGATEITLFTPRPTQLLGRWREAQADRVTFDLSGISGDAAATGEGTLWLRDGRMERLLVNGQSLSQRLAFDFRAGVSAPPEPVSDGTSRWEQLGVNLPRNDYTKVYLETLAECQAACERQAQCRAYTYNTRERMCYLKERAARAERDSDCVSGVKP